MKKHAIATAITLALGISAANAAIVNTGGSFDMYSQVGLDQSGDFSTTSPVNVDPTITGFVDETAGTWGVQSTTLFNYLPWTASSGTLISGPGDYALDTTSGIVSSAAPDTVGTADGIMHFTIGSSQIGGKIDFAWGTTTGIRVVNVWNINADGSLTTAVTGAPGMENGPFPGFNAVFNLTSPGLITPSAVPVPAAVWLFGSGLLGLVGVARRKKAA